MTAAPVAGIVGGPLSGAIMQYLDQVGGLRGWQWLFLLEGIPAVILGFVTLYYLTDRPEDAVWLTLDERQALAAVIGMEDKHREQRHGLTLAAALSDRRIWLLILLYFALAAGSNSFGFFLPKLINSRFAGLGEFKIGLLSAVPNLCAVVCMVLYGAHSDRTGERRWHVAVAAFVSAVGWAVAAWGDAPALSLLGLTLAQVGIMCTLPTFWSLPTALLSGVAAAGGIAMINSIGNLGGLAGPAVMGWLTQVTGSFTNGLSVLAGTMLCGGLLALCARHEAH